VHRLAEAPASPPSAAAAAAFPWTCSKCSIQLPSTAAALLGLQQPTQPGSNAPKFDPLLYLTASMYPRVLNCRRNVSASCQEPLQQVQQLQQLLCEVQQWVGPFHWAAHFVSSAQTGRLCNIHRPYLR
jgi:hypothetical protein